MKIFPILAKRITNSLLLTPQNYSFFTRKLKFSFSEDNNVILVDRGTLVVRNSETFELKLQKINPANRIVSPVSLQFTTLSTLNDLSIQFKTYFNIEEVNIYCQDGTLISKHTAVDALLNQSFIIMSEDYRIKIEGQFLHAQQDSNIKISQLKDNLHQLQLPVVAQRQIQNYIKRVDIWLDAKYYGGQKNNKNKIKTKDIEDILVQSIIDPQHRWKLMAQIEQEWQAKYWQVIELRQKKQQAELMSFRMARRRMLMGMGILVANTTFIWSGTYLFWSWDIIEPIAYFMSSIGAITVFGQTLKLKKPFSLQNYLAYLSEKHLNVACKKIGIDLQQLKSKQLQLQVLECTLKDYLIVKL